ncbi:hypothetical protein DFH08DRAFT_953015 [Mycena albidolilacea]|uniref:Uncharacterized protein n=1 Tax=Mycena albidolilacea TaxID=1033008 RepID=A0AAD7AJ51_9AGAR|nr:hypothetical protein DFH08DRAFT_953015 [Mycena albidolilacea]
MSSAGVRTYIQVKSVGDRQKLGARRATACVVHFRAVKVIVLDALLVQVHKASKQQPPTALSEIRRRRWQKEKAHLSSGSSFNIPQSLACVAQYEDATILVPALVQAHDPRDSDPPQSVKGSVNAELEVKAPGSGRTVRHFGTNAGTEEKQAEEPIGDGDIVAAALEEPIETQPSEQQERAAPLQDVHELHRGLQHAFAKHALVQLEDLGVDGGLYLVPATMAAWV